MAGRAAARGMVSLVDDLISCVDPLGMPFKTLDPFLFCVYHKDMYPPGDAKMQVRFGVP
jgi:hypothetical protein